MSNNTNVPTATTKLSDVPDFRPVYIPKGTYWNHVKAVEYTEKSKSSGNPMFVLTVEICDHAGFIDPKTKDPIDPNGTEATVYLSLTEKALPNLKTFFRGCGLPTDIDLQTLKANPNPAIFQGAKFLAIGSSEATAQIDELTNQPIKNPVTGQDVVFYRYKVGQVFPRS